MTHDLAAKIRTIRTALGLTQETFGERLGTTQGTVSRWEKGAKPEFEYLQAIADLGKMSVNSLVGSEPVPAPEQQPTRSVDRGETVEIIQLDLSLSMGPGTLIDDWTESEAVTFDLAFIHQITRSSPGRLRLVTGIGRSMEPTLQDGDTILIDTTDNLLARQDGIYWVSVYGAAGIKRLRAVGADTVLVISDNKDVAPQEVAKRDLRIEGRAIWAARGL